MVPNFDDTSDVPVTAVLDAIFSGEQVEVAQLYRLSDLTPDALAQFQEHWAAADDLRRQQIARHLADLMETNYVVDFTAVFSHLLDDDNADVRIAALDGMWDTTNTRVVRRIIRLLRDDTNDGVRAAAAASLAHFVLMAEWGQLPKRILPPIVEALLAVYDDPNTAVSVRRAALEALGSSSHERIPGLIEAAYHGDDDGLRLSAVFAMGASADRRWMTILLTEMGSGRTEMRAEAARAAGTIGSSDALDELAELIAKDDEDVALIAVQSVGMIGGERAAEMIEAVLADRDAEALHEMAVEALEEINWLDDNILLNPRDMDDEDDF